MLGLKLNHVSKRGHCWHLAEGRFTKTLPYITHYEVFENYIFANTDICPEGNYLHDLTGYIAK